VEISFIELIRQDNKNNIGYEATDLIATTKEKRGFIL
jgi:hypothetical protein